VADPNDSRPRSQPYLPPPPGQEDDGLDSIHMPRMEPPPSSLEAMVRSRPRSDKPRVPKKKPASNAWWIALLIVATAGSVFFWLR